MADVLADVGSIVVVDAVYRKTCPQCLDRDTSIITSYSD